MWPLASFYSDVEYGGPFNIWIFSRASAITLEPFTKMSYSSFFPWCPPVPQLAVPPKLMSTTSKLSPWKSFHPESPLCCPTPHHGTFLSPSEQPTKVRPWCSSSYTLHENSPLIIKFKTHFSGSTQISGGAPEFSNTPRRFCCRWSKDHFLRLSGLNFDPRPVVLTLGVYWFPRDLRIALRRSTNLKGEKYIFMFY